MGKKCPIAFYSEKERKAFASGVKFAANKYAASGMPAKADRLLRHFEFINAYVSLKNAEPFASVKTKSVIRKFLSLLYRGARPAAFWKAYKRKHSLPSRPSPAAFWDCFEDFQQKRMDVAPWLRKNAKGKILDIGSGSHSYVPVHTACDISSRALAKNKNAKRKIAFNINKKAKLPFASNSFSTIMLNSILAYAANPRRLLAECRRILKPNGVLLITNAPVNDCHPAKYFEKSRITRKKLASWLEKAGFGFSDESAGSKILFSALKVANC